MISLGKTLKASFIFAALSLKVSALSLNPLSVTASIDNVSAQTPNGPILIQDEGEAYTAFADNVRVLRRSGQEPSVNTILSDSNDLPVVIETNGNLQWNDTLEGVKLWGVWQDDDTNEWVIATSHYIDGKRKGAYGSHTTLPSQLEVDHPYTINGDTIDVTETNGHQYYQITNIEDDIIYAVDGDEYPLYEQSFWFTTRAAAEEFYGDLSGDDWATYDDIGATASVNYPVGYALESIDGLKVTIWDGSDSKTLTFSNGYRYTNEEETTKYIYEKTGANEGEITYPFEDESGAVEISQITFLSPNHGTFSWTEYSDSTTNTVLDTSTGNWSILPGSVRSNLQEGYYTGGNPTQVSGGEYVLSGSVSSGSSGVKKMPPELLPIIADDPAGNSFLFIDETEDVVGIEGKVMLPSTNTIDSGIYISLWDAFPLESIGIELVKTEDDNASLRFESDENGYAQDISIPAELDKNYTLRITHRLGKSSFYIDGEEVGALRTATTPDYWGFGAFNANGSSDYNGTVSDIKILNKYPVADYSSPILQDASGLTIIEKSNSDDYRWGFDLNGTTLWAYSPDLGRKRFKYEFKEDTVVRSTINQWDDNKTDEEVTLPYSLSADGLLFIQGADHGDEYFNVIGFDEDKKIITAKYGSTKLDAAHVDFTDFSHNIALRSGKTRTLEISDNGEDPDSFSITDDLGNSLVDFSSIEDLLDYLEEQDENATFPKSIELINQPVISLLQKHIIDNNKSDNFYADPSIAAGHFMQQAFDKAQLGPLSFNIFKGSTIEKNLPYGKNGKSDYTITLPLSSVDINVSTDLMTEFKNEILTGDFNDSALLVVNQFIAKGSPLTDIYYDAFTNDNGLSIISISRTYTDSSTGVNLTDYSILIDLNYTHPSDGSYWLSASLNSTNDPVEYTSFHSALSMAQSFDFNQTWNPPSLSLADLDQNSGTTDNAKDAPGFDDFVSVPFQVTDYAAAINWYNSSWFGDFFQSSNGWIFHPDLGWLYPTASTEPESCWMYGENFGWIWVDSYYFPLFYSDVRSNWIYYYRDYTTAPAFWDYHTGGWSKPGESPISVEEVQARDFINFRNWVLENNTNW